MIAKSSVVARPTLKVSAAKAVKVPAVSTNSMLVWQPTNNKMFETFSFLPPLTTEQIGKQIDYITRNGWTPCLEFAESNKAYVADDFCVRFGNVASNYSDNRYWTLWKLPMFGCTDSSQVIREIAACTRAFPTSYVRLTAFDNVKQVQIMGFLVQRPANAKDWTPVDRRSV
jgi:ribulose-bisphosphate carboxylase small chain